MSIDYLLTHPGGAHKDDFLACSLMIALHGVPLVRREPTPGELEDPRVCVIDVGDRHEPENNNFDHHQFDRDHVPTCALSLVLQHLGVYEDARLFCDWLEPAEWFDTRGPKKTAEWLGVERDIISKMNSPIDISMLRRFASVGKDDRLGSGDPVYELMRMIGEDLLDYLKGVRERIDFVAQRVCRWELEKDGEAFSVLVLPRTDESIDDASGGLARYLLVNGLDQEIAAIVYPDSRGTGYGLARFNDHPKLDFCRVQDEADVHFAHNSGFLCKTSVTDEVRLKHLLIGAWG
ncbi:MYG1 family protein [Verrucomicrobiaceae bacterium N1E253]|uniref:MYG1 family protein n=1 Tax=Oceaniferula marina TaxID=2748318 RepID=A0A851GFW4_9BACT|nr:MYG1 family protein [Oceaniferula marina]NWK55802.1 MYG1 family protein [Oceaniferula marina]